MYVKGLYSCLCAARTFIVKNRHMWAELSLEWAAAEVFDCPSQSACKMCSLKLWCNRYLKLCMHFYRLRIQIIPSYWKRLWKSTHKSLFQSKNTLKSQTTGAVIPPPSPLLNRVLTSKVTFDHWNTNCIKQVVKMQATKFELLELNYKQLAPLLTEDPMLKKKKKRQQTKTKFQTKSICLLLLNGS